MKIEKTFNLDTIIKIELVVEQRNTFYKLYKKKGDFLKFRFVLKPYPHIEKVYADEYLYKNTFERLFGGKDDAYPESYVTFNNHSYRNYFDNEIYYKPHIDVYYTEEKRHTFYFDNEVTARIEYMNLQKKISPLYIENSI